MAKQKSEHLTPLELEIMHVLWETGPSNVQTVQQQLKRDLAYTTVQTMLNILHRKKEGQTDAEGSRLFLQTSSQPQPGRHSHHQ